MMYSKKINSLKLTRFSDDFGGPTIFEVIYDDGTFEYIDELDFKIYADGRYVENGND
jgi:hypothetical protein